MFTPVEMFVFMFRYNSKEERTNNDSNFYKKVTLLLLLSNFYYLYLSFIVDIVVLAL